MATFDTGPLEDVDVVAASPAHMPKGQRRRRVIVCAVLLAVLLCALTAGLVYTVQLQKAQAGLRAALSEKQEENAALQEKNDSLSSENSRLSDELGSEKSQNAALAAENEQLKMQVSLKAANGTTAITDAGQIADNKAKLVALTFDDGPGQYTAELLDFLREHHVRATFFLIGRNAAKYPALIQRMDAEGHAIGNHTQNHARLPRLSAAGVKKEIDDCNAVIRAAVGHDAVMLRAPGGNTNDTVKGVARSLGLPLAHWSVDTKDWQSRNTDKIVSAAFAARSGIKNGSVVLMHDIYRTTVDAAKIIIPRLEAQGYRFVTVPELLALRRGGAVAGEVYKNGHPGR